VRDGRRELDGQRRLERDAPHLGLQARYTWGCRPDTHRVAGQRRLERDAPHLHAHLDMGLQARSRARLAVAGAVHRPVHRPVGRPVHRTRSVGRRAVAGCRLQAPSRGATGCRPRHIGLQAAGYVEVACVSRHATAGDGSDSLGPWGDVVRGRGRGRGRGRAWGGGRQGKLRTSCGDGW
jgi:hypothetical protein